MRVGKPKTFEIARRENPQRWLGEGAKARLDLASEKPLAPEKSGVAPMQKGFWVVQTLEDRNLLKLRSLDSSFPFFLSDNSIWEQ